MEETESQSVPETAVAPVSLGEAGPETQTPSEPPKPIHTLIIDTGPLIKNDPPISTLLAQSQEVYTLPSVIPEIRDAATRSRVETQLLPFLKLRSPKPESIKFVTEFARRTGDLEVLSRPDLHLISLAYELECERNGGDWRLRKEPGQKGVNGKSPAQRAREEEEAKHQEETEVSGETKMSAAEGPAASGDDSKTQNQAVQAEEQAMTETKATPSDEAHETSNEPLVALEEVSHRLDTLTLKEPEALPKDNTAEAESSPLAEGAGEDDDDEDGWITPSNLKKQKEKDQLASPEQPIQRVLQVALLTSDYAMQNVLLRMNLNLVSPSLARITRVKTWVLRCHGCFHITRNMSKQFCPSCGQATLTRVSCSTDQSGNFTIHLKKNFQWNNRGNVYSIPKPTHGTANGKYRGQGGGKNGWGTELLLAEDQKEYQKKVNDEKRNRQKDLWDEDYLPDILTGHRQGHASRVRVGAGRSVNSRKRN